MRSVPNFPAVIPFPQPHNANARSPEPLRATSEFPPVTVELKHVEREELRKLRARLLELIRASEAERRGPHWQRAH